MTSEDPRWARSRATLLEAVTALLDEGKLPTITEIVATAGLSRPTFYQHFGDLTTAYREAALARFAEQFDDIEAVDEADADTVLATVTELLGHLLAHRGFYRLVLADAAGRVFTESVTEFLGDRFIRTSPLGAELRRTGDPSAADRVSVLAAGLVWLIIRWLESDAPEAPAEMAARAFAVMAPFVTITPTSRD